MPSPRPTSSINILFVSPYPPRHGGSAPSLLQLTVALRRRGHAIRVLAPMTPEKEREGFDATFTPTLAGVRLRRYSVPYFLYDYCTIPFDESYERHERRALEDALPRWIQEERPDIIVAAQEPLARSVPAVARKYGIPSVLLLRGDPTWRIVADTFPEDAMTEWLDAFRSADRIVAVAHYFETGLRRHGLENLCTVANHVDLDLFRPSPRGESLLDELDLRDDDVVVLHASKIERRKRPLEIVDSAARALPQCPRLMYVIVGDGPLRKEMETACHARGLSHRFRFTGWVEYSRMPDFFNLADMVLQPSEGEGLARVYLEAMASGRLVVASDIPAAREVIEHGHNGLLFGMGDVADMTTRVLEAAGDRKRRDRLGSAARESVEHYGLDRAAAEYEKVFRAIH